MLTGFVYVYIKKIGLFFIEGSHPSVPSIKTTNALASYTVNCKF